MRPLGVAVIGCGSIANVHLKAIQEIENARLIGVSSRRKEQAKQVSAREKCKWTTDYHELLQDSEVELVCLTTSSGSHGKIGLEVLKHGKHLLVEKPLAMTLKEADQLIKIAEENGLTISVVSQRRFEKQHQAVKEVVSNGGIGKLLFVEMTTPFYRTQDYYDSADWRGTLTEDGGALMNQGIHSIDLMIWLAGNILTVYGKVSTQTHQIEAEDIGTALLTFESGAIGTLMSSTSIQPGFYPTLHLYGEKGTIKLEGTEIKHWTVLDIPEPDLLEPVLSGGGVSNPNYISSIYHKLQIEELIDAIQHRRAPVVTGDDGKMAVKLIHAIYESSKSGKEIHL